MKMLMEDIKKGQFKNIYLLTGEELYLRNQYKKRLRNALLDPEDTMNAASFEGKGINPREIIDLSETMPFFAERRVIMIENSGFVKNTCPELAEYIPEIPESTCLILIESEVDKRGKLYKNIKNIGRVVEFKRQDERTLARWVLGTLKKEGKNITEETMHLFLGRTGSDMENIEKELEKLLCYTLGRDVITTMDVEAVCTEQTENRIFDMVQAITEKDQRKALDLYADLLAMKEPPMRILYLITRQFNQLLQLKSLSGQGLDKSELAKKAGVPPFALGKYQAQCRKFSTEQLRRAVEDCVETEEKVKTGQMDDQISVELLIIKYSRK
ncbi:MAG: DNA polymerase III subunit delta [Lachnospiraceae bacterium]|nr:DNA polymerase III subunit delta [Lachnospiraceae bacterium]